MKQRLTLWQLSLPLSSTARMILCFCKLAFNEDRQRSSCLLSFSLTHMQKKMAEAFMISQMTPHAKRAKFCS